MLGSLIVPVFAWERGRWEWRDGRAATGSEAVLRVLSVGVSHYRDQPCLSYAVRDARAVAKAFRAHAEGLFSRVEVQVLTDDQANRRALLAAFQDLQRQASPGDVTVIYYVGHAGNDEPIGFYLAPGRYHDKFWRQTMLNATDFAHAWEAIPGRVIVLLDTCYTGALWETDEPSVEPSEPGHAEAVLAATRTKEGTKGSRFWSGDFTQVLLQALAGAADADGDGRVTLGELESHLVRRVSARREGRQHVISVVPADLRALAVAKP